MTVQDQLEDVVDTDIVYINMSGGFTIVGWYWKVKSATNLIVMKMITKLIQEILVETLYQSNQQVLVF